MGKQCNSLYRRKDLYSKQLENTRANPTRKLWSSRYSIPRITKNAWVNQEKLLVTRDKKWYQEICSRIYKIPTE